MACGISEDLFLSDSRFRRHISRHTQSTCISVNKTPVKTLGAIRLPIHFGKTVIHQEFEIVKDLIHPLLLGTNFLKTNKAILDFGTEEMTLRGEHIPVGRPEWRNIPPTHLACSEDMILEPQTYTLMRTEIGGPNPQHRPVKDQPKTLLIRALNNDHEHELPILAAWGIVNPHSEEIWIEVLNPGSKPIRVPQGAPVAMVELENPEFRDTNLDPKQYPSPPKTILARNGPIRTPEPQIDKTHLTENHTPIPHRRSSSAPPKIFKPTTRGRDTYKRKSRVSFSHDGGNQWPKRNVTRSQSCPPERLTRFILTRFGSSSAKITDTEPDKSQGISQTTSPLTALVCESTDTMVDKRGQNEEERCILLETTQLGAAEPDTSPLTALVCESTDTMVDKRGQNEEERCILLETTPLGVLEPKPPPLTALVCESTDTMVDKEGQNDGEGGIPELISIDEEDEGNTGSKNEFKVKWEGTTLNEEEKTRLQTLMDKFPEIFAKNSKDLGETTLMHHYARVTTEKPVHAPFYRAPPPNVREDIDRETENLLASGVVRESQSPYSAPIVLVRKKCGGWRYCTDFRKLNKVTEKVSFPLPNIQDRLRRLGNPKVMTTMDLLKGYFQIGVAESQKKYFGFSDGKRHLEYNRTPMGAKNSGATMAALMELVFRGLPAEFILSYLDDILVATPDFDTHLEVLEKVFSALSRAGLKLHPGKCEFARSSVTTLGYLLDETGIKPDPKNLEKVEKWPTPTDTTGVRGFLGLANYYRNHIHQFAKIAEPLTTLLQKDKLWAWEKTQNDAFLKLRDELLAGNACAYPDFDKEFFLKSDGCDTTVGAVLTQKDEKGHEKIVACASQKLNSTEEKWAPYDKELFGIVWAVRQFSHYLRFRKFTIITDHQPLLSCLSVDTKKDATGKRTRWALELNSYEFEIKHKKGKLHTDADAFSRAPHADPPKPSVEEDIVTLGAISHMGAGLASLFSQEECLSTLMDEQAKDPEIGTLKQIAEKRPTTGRIESYFINKLQNLKVIKGILYILNKNPKTGEQEAKVIIPKSLVEETLHRAHGDYYAGHPGETRTLARIHRFCTWSTIRKDTQAKVQGCPQCQANRPGNKKGIPIRPQTALYPLHFVQADLLQFQTQSQGYDHVLVIEDRFTKFCCLYPIFGKETKTVARKLENFITRFGCPVIWGTDNGGEFKSKLIHAICRSLKIKKEFSMEYHPQSNGQTERKNRTIIQELSKRVAQYGPLWSKYLPWVEFNYNTTPHTATGYTPYMLMHGREARTPLHDMVPIPAETKGWKNEHVTYIHEHQEKLQQANKMREELHAQYRENMIKQREKKGVQPAFEVGAKVWCRIPTEDRTKLSLHNDGPWTIIKRLDPSVNVQGNTYVIRNEKGDEKVRPHSDLKEFTPDTFPSKDSHTPDTDQSTPDIVREEHKNSTSSTTTETYLKMLNLIGRGPGIFTRSRTAAAQVGLGQQAHQQLPDNPHFPANREHTDGGNPILPTVNPNELGQQAHQQLPDNPHFPANREHTDGGNPILPTVNPNELGQQAHQQLPDNPPFPANREHTDGGNPIRLIVNPNEPVQQALQQSHESPPIPTNREHTDDGNQTLIGNPSDDEDDTLTSSNEVETESYTITNDRVLEPQGNDTSELEWSDDQYPSEEETQTVGQEETDLDWSDDLYRSTSEESENNTEGIMSPTNRGQPLPLEGNTPKLGPPNHPLATGDTLPMPYSEYLQHTQTREPTKQMIRELKRLAPYNKPGPEELGSSRRKRLRSERK